MINGKVHAWEDIRIFISGVPVAGIKEISWSDEREAEAIYGAGRKPIGAGLGNYKVGGSFTLTKEEADKFEAPARAAGKSVYDYKPFTIVIAYEDPDPSDNSPLVEKKVNPLRTETIVDVIITKREVSASQNDKEITYKYSFIAREVRHG